MKNLCGSCRECCKRSLIKVTEKEILDWKKKQRYNILLCIERWPGFGAYFMTKEDSDECIFLDDASGCTIYSERPKICRDFPKGEIHVEQFDCALEPQA